MKYKRYIPRPLSVVLDKILITRRSLLLRITRKHALQTHTHALDVVDGRPALAIKKVEADDAVGVDVRVPGDRVGVGAEEDDFGGLQRALV